MPAAQIILNSTAENAPRIAWDNLLEDGDATITTDSEVSEFEHQNAFDWLPFTHWKPANASAHYITGVWSSAQDANYFAFYAHDLHEFAGTLTLQYSTDGGSVWQTAVAVTPTDGAPVYESFDTISAARWRVKMQSTGSACKLGVVAFGVDMPLERGVWIGFTPPELGRDNDLTTILSDNGTFLGRSIVRNMFRSALDLDYLTFGWVYETWTPFVIHAEIKPWFFRWNSTTYENNVAFCWVMKAQDIENPKIQKRRHMSAGIKFQCNCE